MEEGHEEVHVRSADLVRDFVFGFGDGINTSLGIAAGVGAATVSSSLVILAAVVGMFTGAKAMAVQNYLAVKSQKQVLQAEIRREAWEVENLSEAETLEIMEIYKAKGFKGALLNEIVKHIISNPKRWLRTMVVEELGLNPEVENMNPLKNATVMFLAFIIGGVLPILPYLMAEGLPALLASIGISLVASFLVGLYKGRLTGRNMVTSGLEMMLLGTGIALVGYGIGGALGLEMHKL